MAISWQNAYGSACKIGVEWNAGSGNGNSTYTLAPKVYRYDASSTDNYGSSWSEKLQYEPSGSQGSWSGLGWGSGSGTRQVDYFNTRTYNRTTSAQTVKLIVSADESFGTYSGGWVNIGSKTFTFSTTIPALTSYAISYNANGGSGTTSAQTKYYDNSLTLRANGFTRSGYTFKRWNTNASDTGTGYNASASYTANAAATLYAIWNRTVTFNANGGTGAPAAQTGVATSAIVLTTAAPTRTGFDFTGWNTAEDGSGTSYSAGGSYPANNPSVVLYAQWRSAATITSLTAVRCSDNQGTQDDMGTYADVTCVWENPNSDATISGPITPVGGSATALTFSTTSSGTVYTSTTTIGDEVGESGAIDTDTQYNVTATLSVSGVAVASKTIILTKSAFVMDFKAGGTGIGIGTAAPASGLEVAWPATFDGDVSVSGTTTLSGTTMTGVIQRIVSSGISYIEGNQGDAVLYLAKPTGRVWYPAVTLDTYSGGSWSMGNYDSETLKFSWASKENRDSGTNSVSVVELRNTTGTIALVPTQLYNNTTGTNGTVTLSASAANYNHMRIYYRASDNNGSPVNSVDIYSPNGKRFSLWTVHTTDGKGFTVRGSMWYISGTSMTVAGQGGVGWLSSGSWSGSSDTQTSNIYVVRVEGWNE